MAKLAGHQVKAGHYAEPARFVATARTRLAAVLRRATYNHIAPPARGRLNGRSVPRLGARARRCPLAARAPAQGFVEEGLRKEGDPLVRFRGGPGGRRARLLGTGKDVWE